MRTSAISAQEEALSYMHRAAESMRHYAWVERAWLFGSYARGEQHPASDVDILLACTPGTTYFQIFDLQFELEGLLSKKIDLILIGGLSPHIAPYIHQDKILFYMKAHPSNDKHRISHMLEAAENAIIFLDGISYEMYVEDYKLRLATVKLLEIIGEAANAVSQDLKNRYPQVPWKKAVALRNVTIHEYFSIDYPTIWLTIKHDLPVLSEQLKQVILEL